MNKRIIVGIIVAVPLLLIVLGVIGVTVFLSSTPQDARSRAQVVETSPTVSVAPSPTTCPSPETPQNVLVEYPHCTSAEICSFFEASCTWDAVTSATSYDIKITEVETSTAIKTETVTSTAKYVFPVTQNRTYKCDVTAKNTCGGASAVGTYSLFCEVKDGAPSPTVPVATATPTTPVIATPTLTPTPTLVPTVVTTTSTPSAQTTIAPTGELGNAIAVGGIALMLLIVGGIFFVVF